MALEVGYNLFGVSAPGPFEEHAHLGRIIDRGFLGTMSYLSDRASERSDPALVAPWVKSVIVMGMFYETPHPHTEEVVSADNPHGDDPRLWISRYGWGRDYHRVLTSMNRKLLRKMKRAFGEEARFRFWVDTGPVMEKVFAVHAGLGWMGKNTMVINPTAGSWFFLSAWFTDLELVVGDVVPDHCGSCTRCLDVCPTDAFAAPYVLDATRCISYRTIETREDTIPEDVGDGLSSHLFGCDLCQDVCPFNKKSPMTTLSDFHPRSPGFAPRRTEVEALLDDPEAYDKRTQGSPIRRAKVHGLRRTLGWLDEAKARSREDVDS
jgi:epoxyqueuosine reductase